MKLHQSLLGAAAICCTLAGAAFAGNDTPPPWAGQGLQGNSTHWHWDFQQGPVGPQVGTGFGPPNAPAPVVTGGTWVPTAGNGAWMLLPGESITIDLFNYPNPNDFKLIYIQYHLLGGPLPPTPPLIQVDFNGTAAVPFGPPTLTPTPDGGLIGAQGFRFPFNPPFEIIHIINTGQTPMLFEWLTIDTICAPTPGAGAAMVLGSAALLRRRRR
jgi:hypothetical protein